MLGMIVRLRDRRRRERVGLDYVRAGIEVCVVDRRDKLRPRQIQNIGIIPDVKAEPTIRGIRAGRDEVLEKGVETLKRLISEGTVH